MNTFCPFLKHLPFPQLFLNWKSWSRGCGMPWKSIHSFEFSINRKISRYIDFNPSFWNFFKTPGFNSVSPNILRAVTILSKENRITIMNMIIIVETLFDDIEQFMFWQCLQCFIAIFVIQSTVTCTLFVKSDRASSTKYGCSL